jgi:flagellar biosynthesis/type III secretory pathway protein FliH
LNRVIRNASLATAPQAFGPAAPQLIDDYMTQLIEQAQAEAFEAGRSEGFAAGRAETSAAAGRIEAVLADVAADLVRMRAECVREAVEAGLEVAEFVLGRAPHDMGESLAPRIEAALGNLDDEQLVVTIHPQDWDVISAAVRLPNGVTMERDPSLQPGEARISGRWASAELTREAALSVVREVLS